VEEHNSSIFKVERTGSKLTVKEIRVRRCSDV
jgi:hypothetical protein